MTPKVWTLPPVALVVGAAAFVWSQYDSLPERIPVHYGLHGADRWADKSPEIVLLPGLIGLLGLMILAAKAWRLEGLGAGQVWRKVALAWVVGVIVSVLLVLPLFQGGGGGGL